MSAKAWIKFGIALTIVGTLAWVYGDKLAGAL